MGKTDKMKWDNCCKDCITFVLAYQKDFEKVRKQVYPGYWKDFDKAFSVEQRGWPTCMDEWINRWTAYMEKYPEKYDKAEFFKDFEKLLDNKELRLVIDYVTKDCKVEHKHRLQW